jgi:hypothetical protein
LHESEIILALSQQFFKNRILMAVDHCYWTGHECDVLGVTKCLKLIDIEIKVSRSDFRADRRKDKWWHDTYYKGDKRVSQRDWPPKVWKHYFVMPREIFSKDLVKDLPSRNCGIILAHKPPSFSSVVLTAYRGARANPDPKRLTAENMADIGRLISLRLWEARAELARRSC